MEEEDTRPYSVVQQQVLPEDRASLAIATDPAKLLFQIEHSLRGEALDQNGNWVQVTTPLANKDGVGAIILDLSSKLSHNTTLSNLTEREVGVLTQAIAKRIRLLLVQNYKRYEIKISDFTLIKDLITEPTYFALKRSMNQGERKFWSKTVSESRNIVERPQERRGLLDGIFKRAR